ACIQYETHALGFQSLLQLGHHVSVLPRQDLATVVNNRDAAAEPAKHLAKLQPDVAATQDEQMLGYFGKFHDAGVGEVFNRLQAWKAGNVRPRSRIDEDALALQQLVSHFDLPGAGESGMPAVKVQALPGIDPALLPGAKAFHNLVLAGHDRRQIDAHIASLDAPARGMARVVSNLGAGHHGLGGSATGVDASATQLRLLHQGYRPAEIGQPVRERTTSLPRTDDDGVVIHEGILFSSQSGSAVWRQANHPAPDEHSRATISPFS